MIPNQFIHIENDAQAIASTNFYDTEVAADGKFYLSWNSGAGRLLVPDNQKPCLREMKTASHVVVSSGPWAEEGGRPALELLFEDRSDAPFVLTLSQEQSDRHLPACDQAGQFFIAVWTRGGMKLRLPARYRKVPILSRLGW